MIIEYPYQSKEWWREYRKRNIEKLRAYKREYDKKRYQTHYEIEKARRIKWADKNPHKVKAHRIVRDAVKKGSLVKQPCIICKEVKVIAHHDDYNKPLDVLWLCEIHHKQRHAKDKTYT